MTTIEQMRLKLAANTDAQHKAQLGQFLTPASTARFMAGLFDNESGRICRLLDGAGIGSLASASWIGASPASLLFSLFTLPPLSWTLHYTVDWRAFWPPIGTSWILAMK